MKVKTLLSKHISGGISCEITILLNNYDVVSPGKLLI